MFVFDDTWAAAAGQNPASDICKTHQLYERATCQYCHAKYVILVEYQDNFLRFYSGNKNCTVSVR